MSTEITTTTPATSVPTQPATTTAAPASAAKASAKKPAAAKAATGTKKTGTKKAAAAAAPAATNTRLVHATLPKRQVRVVFKEGNKVVATSPVYKSGNTLENIVNYARKNVIGASKEGLKAILEQTEDGKKFKQVSA